MFLLKSETFKSALRIGVMVMAAAVVACASSGKGPSNDGFINGVRNIISGEYETRERALQADLDRLVERQAALEAKKQALTIERQYVVARINRIGRELAEIQRSLSTLPPPGPSPEKDRFGKFERRVMETKQELDDLERTVEILIGPDSSRSWRRPP